MYLAKKRLQRTKQLLKRDNDLGYPVHKSDKKNPERAAFLSELAKNTDFALTLNKNHEKFKDSAQNIIKKFNGFDYFCIAMFGICASVFSFCFSSVTLSKTKADVRTCQISTQKVPAACLVWATIGLLLGLGIGVANQVSLARANKDGNTENLFNRLSVRLFDSVREEYPDLNEKVLKNFNPELARAIYALIIANISDEDVRQIQEIATKIARKLHSITQKNENNVLLSCNDDIKQAMSIIELNLTTNTPLYEALLSLYRGNIPAKFSLQNLQKSR